MKGIYKYCLVIASLSLASAAHGSESDVDTEHRVTPPTGSNESSGRSSISNATTTLTKEEIKEAVRKKVARFAKIQEREELVRRAGEKPGATGRGKIIWQ